MVGFAQGTATSVPLSATESLAQLTFGTNTGNNGVTTPAAIATSAANNAIDNPFPANSGTTPLLTTAGGTTQINTSLQPILLRPEDIDISSSQTRGISNAVIAPLTTLVWAPWVFLGIGAQIEFGDLAGKVNLVHHDQC